MRRTAPYVVLLAAALSALIASAAWAMTRQGGQHASAAGVPTGSMTRTAGGDCTVPAARGSVVNVRLMGMSTGSGMMGGGGMMGGRRSGMMLLRADRTSVAAGRVTFHVWNMGGATHELVVLPLRAGRAGERSVGADDRVSEAGSLGEASRSCGAGAGDGIAPGTAGWVTLELAPGRYELVCNLAGHYRAGMYAELDVT